MCCDYKKHGLLLAVCLLLWVSCSKKYASSHNEEREFIAEVEEEIIHIPFVDRVVIEKDFLYDKYTLEDEYPYKEGTREFQWDKIRSGLALIDSVQNEAVRWGIVQNRHNKKGIAPLVENYKRNKHNLVTDTFGIERHQGIPLYKTGDSIAPFRYALDGSLVKLLESDSVKIKLKTVYFEGEWLVPKEYVKEIEPSTKFSKVIFVDCTNQNIATIEKSDSTWLVRSMNPATTGLENPPYHHETPPGLFVVLEKKNKMYYYKDGTTDIAGYAPYASRFCKGAYIHGIPVNNPNGAMIEYGHSLGTTPRSHMCVRNATSHAKFIYDRIESEAALVFVIK